jgi:flagellar assembly protein FliH
MRLVRLDADPVDKITDAIDDEPDAAVLSTSIEPKFHINPQELLDEAKAKAEQVLKKADKILEDARNESADLLYFAKEDAEEERKKAWSEGYSKGLQEGTREGKHSFDTELSKSLAENEESLKRVLKELHDERELTYTKLEKDTVELALRIVKKIINPADEILGDVFESLIVNALKQIAPDGRILLRVSTADYEKYFSSGNATFDLGGGVTVAASVLRDVALDEFSVIIDKDDGAVNAGLDTQLKQIELAFSRG